MTNPELIINAKVVTLTPTKCRLLLERNAHNRKPSAPTIKLYADQMQNGSWQLNGEPIIIADNGDVLDGQHRMRACVESGTPFQTLIVYNVPRDSFGTIDTGKTRNGADVLTISTGMKPEKARICAAAAGKCIDFSMTGTLQESAHVRAMSTPDKRATWIMEHPRIVGIVDTIMEYGRPGRIIAAGDSAFLWYFMEQKSDLTYDFFDGFLSGINLSEHDPRLALRQKIESSNRSTSRLHKSAKIGSVVRAWDWYVRGKETVYHSNYFRDLNTALTLLK